MQVIATAGHVDHGKSTLIRVLTGMEPDRWAEERRRGMTIDLGYAWTRLPSGAQVAFVDVPGHERFTTNMLAGIGPVPAVLLVIAADEGWAAQTEEHVRALDALGVRRGLLAVTRCDLADPAAAIQQAARHLSRTSLAGLAALSVSGATGQGVPALREALDELAASLPIPDPRARVRLWVDRAFSIRGSGTVVTGTLAAGTIRRGDSLELAGVPVAVRGLECLGEPLPEVRGAARVALNLRGVDLDHVRRGDALLTPHAWQATDVVDVRCDCGELPSHVVVHIGAAAVPATVRPLNPAGDDLVISAPAVLTRLLLSHPLPLQVGDRVLLRDPGRRQVLGGATVLDPMPPALRRRGAARARAGALATDDGSPDLGAELRRRRAVSRDQLARLGVPVPTVLPPGTVAAAGWLCSHTVWEAWRRALLSAVDGRPEGRLLDAGVGRAELVAALGLPDPQLLESVLGDVSELEEVRGRIQRRGSGPTLRPTLQAAVARLAAVLREQPFSAPEQAQLAALGLGRRELGAASAAGAVLRLPGEVILLPDAPQQAVARLRGISEPFTLSAARQALGTTRRVAVPLLEHLDGLGLTQRVDDTARRLVRR